MNHRKETILDRWHISATQLTEVVDANPSLRGIMLGYMAELKLREMWFDSPEITKHLKYDDHDRSKKGDLVVSYKGKDFTIESKSLQTNTISLNNGIWSGKVQCDASDRRVVTLPNGKKIETTCLLVGEFDLLAVNLFAFENKWRFMFAKNSELPRSKFKKYTSTQQKYLLATLIDVTWPPKPPFRDEPFSLLDEML
jgi:hypothetical protein